MPVLQSAQNNRAFQIALAILGADEEKAAPDSATHGLSACAHPPEIFTQFHPKIGDTLEQALGRSATRRKIRQAGSRFSPERARENDGHDRAHPRRYSHRGFRSARSRGGAD